MRPDILLRIGERLVLLIGEISCNEDLREKSMKFTSRRMIVLSAVLLLALTAVSVAGAFIPFENPNYDLNDQAAPYGVPEHWMVLGDAVAVEEPQYPGNWAVLFPDTNKTSALYQVFGAAEMATPDMYYVEGRYSAKNLTADTAFVGVIITLDDNSKMRAYKRIPAGGALNKYIGFTPYIGDGVDHVMFGAVYFGKRGDGTFVIHYLRITND